MIRFRTLSPAVVLFLLIAPVWAGTLKVSAQWKPKTDIGGNLVPSTGTININDPNYAGMDIKISQEIAGKQVMISKAGDKVGATGVFNQTSNAVKLRPIYIVHIGPANAGDTWVVLGDGTILNKAGRVDTKSFEERKAQEQAQGNLGNLGGAPLNVATAFFYSDSGQENYILEFTNQSPNMEYSITSLTVYQGLDPQYFTPASFNSEQAIASGSLAFDTGALDSEGGLVIPSMADGFPFIDVPSLGVPTSGYELIMGQAAPISVDDQTGSFVLGSPIPFVFAQSAMPLPSPQPSPTPQPTPSPQPTPILNRGSVSAKPIH